MARMIRRQFYITKRQQVLLTRLTKLRGITESEVIRQAIKHEANGNYVHEIEPDLGNLDDLIEFALSRRKSDGDNTSLRWRREDAYSDRLDRYGSQAE